MCIGSSHEQQYIHSCSEPSSMAISIAAVVFDVNASLHYTCVDRNVGMLSGLICIFYCSCSSFARSPYYLL